MKTFERDGVTVRVVAHFSLSRDGFKRLDQLAVIDIRPDERAQEAVQMLRELSRSYIGKTEFEWDGAVLSCD